VNFYFFFIFFIFVLFFSEFFLFFLKLHSPLIPLIPPPPPRPSPCTVDCVLMAQAAEDFQELAVNFWSKDRAKFPEHSFNEDSWRCKGVESATVHKSLTLSPRH
jgi:hypothetical protein